MTQTRINMTKQRQEQNVTLMRVAETATPEKGWRERGRCRGMDPEIFFPTEGGSGIGAARRTCDLCTERISCAATALALGGTCSGVWGGTTETERLMFRRIRSKERARSKSRKGASA